MQTVRPCKIRGLWTGFAGGSVTNLDKLLFKELRKMADDEYNKTYEIVCPRCKMTSLRLVFINQTSYILCSNMTCKSLYDLATKNFLVSLER
ncbi:MAG: hypothetical protein ABI361_09270 [Nitrososphaera sp.]